MLAKQIAPFLASCFLAVAALCTAAPGDFDRSFGVGGVLDLGEASAKRIPAVFPYFANTGGSLVLDKSGKLYVGGGFNYASFVARVLANGTLDRSFSADGVLIRTGFRASTSATDTIAILPTGRIVTSDTFIFNCTGVCPPGFPDSGRLVDTFSAKGKPTSTVGEAVSMGMTSDGATVFNDGGVVALNRSFDPLARVFLRALRADGVRDFSFEKNAQNAFNCSAKLTDVWHIISKVDAQDRLVVVVTGPINSPADKFATCVFRLMRDGWLDTGFGVGGGVTFTDETIAIYRPTGIAFSPEGGIRMALRPERHPGSGATAKAAQIRLTAAGLPDGRFKEGAMVSFDTPFVNQLSLVYPLADGTTLAFGSTAADLAFGGIVKMVRMAGMAPDKTFGPNADGIASIWLPGGDAPVTPSAIAVSEADASIYLLLYGGTKLAKLQGAIANTPPRYDGLWWRSPAGSEAGWGLNMVHQDNIIFATWTTYDSDGSPMWLVMPRVERVADGKFAGSIYRTAGQPFSQTPFNQALIKTTEVGTASFDFTDANNGVFSYSVDGISQSKPIARQAFGALPRCTVGGMPSVQAHYQGLWWNAPANSESGWGINLTHQSDTLFATWHTYDETGRAIWFVMSSGERTAAANPTYRGTLYKTRGPAFNAMPWAASAVSVTPVGTASFSFSDPNLAQFDFTVGAFSQRKQLTRQLFSSPISDCR